jgi:hypothetical protein
MKKTKEEIRTKWIRHTPLLALDECVDNAMQEYANQCLEENSDKKYTDEDLLKILNIELKKAYEHGQRHEPFTFKI